MNLKVGDCIRLYAAGKHFRPGIVLRFSNIGWIVVAIGTTTDRSDVKGAFSIRFPSDDATDMGLDRTTWFTGEIKLVRPDSADRIVERYKGRCPPGVFMRIVKLVEGTPS